MSPAAKPTPQAPAKKPPVIPIAIGAVVLIVVIGLIIALTGSDDSDDDAIDEGASSPAVTGGSDDDTGDAPTGDDAAFGEITVDGDSLPTFESPADDPAIGEAAPRSG